MKALKVLVVFVLFSLVFVACQKEYSIETKVNQNSAGTWEFSEGSNQYVGNIDTAFIDSSAAVKILYLVGTTKDGSQNFLLQLYGQSFGTGDYRASAFETSFKYSAGSTTIYQGNQLSGEFIVSVTTYGNNLIAGTFRGEVKDASGNTLQVTNGKFTSTLLTGSAVGISSGVFGDSSGFCSPASIGGVYSPGVALTSSNTVSVAVIVAQPGTYSIVSNSVNGISFSASGTFAAAGPQTVILAGAGTPQAAGINDFTLTYGNSQCGFSVNVSADAAYVLGGSNSTCSPLNIGGVYEAGRTLDATNTIELQVNVTTAGNYNIYTDTLNGFSFSASGTFTSTGVQNVILTGAGMPAVADTNTFKVTADTDNCSFDIIVQAGTLPPPGDYFPVTMNSNWSYSLIGGTTADSIKTIVIDYLPTYGGNSYSTFTTDLIPPSTFPDSSYYRKPGGDYYQYFVYSDYIPFDQTVAGELVFLKDNVAAGTTWQSPDISGTVGGIPFVAYIKMTLLEKGVSVTMGSFTFNDVIKVKYEYYVAGSSTIVETDTRWFARDVGEIFFDFDDGTNKAAYQIGAYQVF